MTRRKRVAILISGRGSNMRALIDAAAAPDYPAEIVGVFSNRAASPGLDYARERGVATKSLAQSSFDTREAFDSAITAVLQDWGAEIVCLAGFMRILSSGFIDHWMGRAINIHPSLLPEFKGLDPHGQAIAAGVTSSGCTVHFVTHEMDAGPIIAQAKVPVFPDDTAEALAARVLKEEHQLYPLALAQVCRAAWRSSRVEIRALPHDYDQRNNNADASMTFIDDDLTRLEAEGIPALPPGGAYVEADGARVWYASFGAGPPVVLLHGGLGNAGNWGHQVPALTAAGYRSVVVDSRGQGRSSRDDRPYSYELMAADTRAVLDALEIPTAAFIGWSDGAATSLVLAHDTPHRAAGVFFFGCNVDDTGTLPFQATPVIDRIYNHHVRDYAALSPIAGGFEQMRDDLGVMQASQPGYSADDLAAIAVPVWSVLGKHDEFIKRGHAEYIADAIPGASFHLLPGVSHFAPLQRPALFNAAMLDFLKEIEWSGQTASE